MTDVRKPPRVDRRQLQQIIAGLSEGLLLFDTEGNIVWANAAALALYGIETPADLDADSTAFFERFNLHYRNHHEVRKNDLPVARLLAGHPFTDLIVEVTSAGEAEAAKQVHSLRGLILTNPAGEPESLVLVIKDVTEQFGAEDRFERTFNANPAPAIICDLTDLRFVKVNQGFLAMTGYTREAVIGRSVYEIDVLRDAANRDDAIERLNNWQTIPQTESLLLLPDSSRRPVIVAGQPIDLNNARCILFTFMDLEPRKRAESLLRQSEERFAKAFQLAPVPMVLTTRAELKIIDINDAFATAFGATALLSLGKPSGCFSLWQDDAQRRSFEKSIGESTTIRNFEARLRALDNLEVDSLISAEVVSIHGQDCVLSVILDISDRKRSEVDLMAAIEAVMRDTSWFSQTVIEKLANLRQVNRSDQYVDLSALTAREREVLELICQDLTDNEISGKLGLSRNTIRNHVATLYGKIDVHRRSAAVVWARERGITGPKNKPSKRR